MKKFLTLLILLISSLCLKATEYGTYKSNNPVRYVVTSSEVVSYKTPNFKAKTVRQFNAGDIIYVDTSKKQLVDGMPWVKITGTEEYIFARYLTSEANPNYVHKSTSSNVSTDSIFKFGFYNLPKWLGWTLLVVWILLSIGTCLYINHANVIPPFLGYKYKNMNKSLFFKKQPYICFLYCALAVLAAFIVAILLFIAIGTLVWLSCWVGRVLLIVLFWIFLVACGIGAIGGFGLLVVEDAGCLAKILGVLGGIFLGFLCIVMFAVREDVADFGESMVEWGQEAFSTFNIISVSLEIVKTYWATALLVAFTPFIAFLLAALLYMIFAGSMRLWENFTMKRYNVTHPCPNCQQPSEPAVYISHGYDLPVVLRPSIYGLFNITHPDTGEKMPTLFLNGKDRLMRRCPHCDSIIDAKIGTEKHIAFAGATSSGKSTLLYRLLAEMLRNKYGRFTDDLGVDATELKSLLSSISNGEEMTSQTTQTDRGRRRSIQMRVARSGGNMPYRVYFNDVAGELFSIGSSDTEDMVALKNADTLILVVDPSTLKTKELSMSDRMKAWYKAQKLNDEDTRSFYDAVTRLQNLSKYHMEEKDLKKLHVMVTFVKADLGYLGNIDVNNEDELREFALSDLGLGSAFDVLESCGFGRISYHAVSAWKSVQDSQIDKYLEYLMRSLGIEITKLDEKSYFKAIEYEKKCATLVKEENSRYDVYLERKQKFDSEHPLKYKWSYDSAYDVASHFKYKKDGRVVLDVSLVLFILLIVAVAGISISIGNKHKKDNYKHTTASYRMMEKNNASYDQTIDFLSAALKTKEFFDDDRKAIEKTLSDVRTQKQIKIDDLMAVAYSSLNSTRGLSSAEMCARYGAVDTLRELNAKLDELSKLVPDDEEYKGYRQKFDNLIIKYKIKL